MTTPLGDILNRMAQERESRFVDVRVDGVSDRLGIEVGVRYAAKVRQGALKEYVVKRKKTDPKDWEVMANLDAIVDCCIGVYAVPDGVKVGMTAAEPADPAEWPRFDAELGRMLPDGVGESAVSVARGLFEWPYNKDELAFADRDIIRHGTAIMDFYSNDGPDDSSGG